MIGIKDTLELNAARYGRHDRLADRIFGVQRTNRTPAEGNRAASPQPSPLRQYTGHNLLGLPGGIGQPRTLSFNRHAKRHAA
ncbi:MAG TPA: hypothetical protein DEA90_11975 [Opitutae bacterium]|nr:hypothetical protein [Puniceicoccaceae bacterium]HBR94871.1 hypothetical protein [Opitutae bacterium]|tara:strand:+ start:2821 stop:3066 length:246 start_codon:yes stop_codon:yes gene_type:complete